MHWLSFAVGFLACLALWFGWAVVRVVTELGRRQS